MALCHRMASLWLGVRTRATTVGPQTAMTKRCQSTMTSDVAAATHYPYGPATWYKQSNRGLYGGQMIRFGNKVSDKNEIKTRRHWSPNIKQKYLFSKALGRSIQVRVSTRVLRTIDKVGGLDEYLLKDTAARIKDLGIHGWRLRCQIIGSQKMQLEYNEEREALGLPQLDYAEVTAEALDVDAPTNVGRTTNAGRQTIRTIRRTM